MDTVVFTALGTGSLTTRRTRRPALYHLRWGKGDLDHLVLECSYDTRERLLDAGEVDLAGVPQANILATHVHSDHFIGAMELEVRRVFNKNTNGMNGIFIRAPRQAIEAFDVIKRALMPEYAWVESHHPDLQFAEVTDQSEFRIGEALVHAFQVHHGKPTEAVGYRITIDGLVFSYTGDAAHPPDGDKFARERDGLEALFSGADVVLCDASGKLERPNHRHLNAREAGALAAKHNILVLLLTHISGFDSEEEMIKACRDAGFRGEVFVAYDGMVMEF